MRSGNQMAGTIGERGERWETRQNEEKEAIQVRNMASSGERVDEGVDVG